MKNLFTLCLFFLGCITGFAQTSIAGKIIDESTGEELIGANITFSQKGIFVTGTSTDFDGNYKIAIDPGFYTIEISYVGFPTKKIKGVYVEKGQSKQVDVAMESPMQEIHLDICWKYKIPLLRIHETSSGLTIGDYDIELLPTKTTTDIIGLAPGLTFSQ